MITQLDISQIRLDGGTQIRVALDQEVVSAYADNYRNQIEMPPIIAYFDGTHYWLADGFHRVAGAIEAGLTQIAVEIRDGTIREALLCAIEANAAHGLRWTNADKRRAVETLLRDDEWAKWSDREIARHCGASQPFVGGIRASLITVISDERTYTTKHGSVATMRVGRIGGDGLEIQPVQSDDETSPAPVAGENPVPACHAGDPAPELDATGGNKNPPEASPPPRGAVSPGADSIIDMAPADPASIGNGGETTEVGTGTAASEGEQEPDPAVPATNPRARKRGKSRSKDVPVDELNSVIPEIVARHECGEYFAAIDDDNWQAQLGALSSDEDIVRALEAGLVLKRSARRNS